MARDMPATVGIARAATTPLLQELAQSFFQLMMRHRVAMRDVMLSFGLSPPLMMTLHMLEGPPATMRELADIIGLEPSNLTSVVDKLEARGLVERQSAPDDRRVKRVALTRSGRAMRKRIVERLKQPAPWMAGLDTEDQRLLLGVLQRVLGDAPGSDDLRLPPSQKSSKPRR